MKAILFCTIALYIAGIALSLRCLSCSRGSTCEEAKVNCSNGEEGCITVNGTVNGVMQHYKGCAFHNNCSQCERFINATDCKSSCCIKDNCNAEKVPDTTSAATTSHSGSNITGSSTTAASIEAKATTKATTTAAAGIASVDILGLVSLSVLGYLSKII